MSPIDLYIEGFAKFTQYRRIHHESCKSSLSQENPVSFQRGHAPERRLYVYLFTACAEIAAYIDAHQAAGVYMANDKSAIMYCAGVKIVLRRVLPYLWVIVAVRFIGPHAALLAGIRPQARQTRRIRAFLLRCGSLALAGIAPAMRLKRACAAQPSFLETSRKRYKITSMFLIISGAFAYNGQGREVFSWALCTAIFDHESDADGRCANRGKNRQDQQLSRL